MQSNAKHLLVAQKLFPACFTSTFHPPGNNRYKYEGIKDIKVIHLNPPQKYSAAHYRVQITYDNVYQHYPKPRGTWELLTGRHPTVTTPDIVVIQREEVAVDHYTVMQAMVEFFKANVLILKRYTGESVSRKSLKDAMRMNGIWLLFADELQC